MYFLGYYVYIWQFTLARTAYYECNHTTDNKADYCTPTAKEFVAEIPKAETKNEGPNCVLLIF
ncbi:MAG: hypothetical protein EHM38_10815 [Geobacteraceae bacterium]|nr:MAG: hypothetical protein EHM38_10815 [Geobacteraceae bacterium]